MKKIILFLSVGIVGIIIIAIAWLQGCVYLFASGLILTLLMLILCIAAGVKQGQIIKFLIAGTKPEYGNKPDGLEMGLIRKRIELSIFDNQINPHFLYNTLENIRGEAIDNGQQGIADMTEHLSRFFRYCISSRGLFVKLSEEIRNVKDYICIQKYRFGDMIDLKWRIDDGRALDYYIPKLTLQPIVENAIVHGITQTGRKGHIVISVYMTEERLYVCVEDDGDGMDFNQLERINQRLQTNQVEVSVSGKRHTGIAIQNINSRIRLCFGEEYGMHYRSAIGCGTQVEITLPLADEYSRAELENKYNEVL